MVWFAARMCWQRWEEEESKKEQSKPGIWNVLTWFASFSISQYDIQLVMIGHAQNIILENEKKEGGGNVCIGK